LTISSWLRLLHLFPFVAEVAPFVGGYETADALAQAHDDLLAARVGCEEMYSFTSDTGEGGIRYAEQWEEEGEEGEWVEEEGRLRDKGELA
jgi:hypothetical protein